MLATLISLLDFNFSISHCKYLRSVEVFYTRRNFTRFGFCFKASEGEKRLKLNALSNFFVSG